MWGVDFFQDPYDFHMRPKREKELNNKFKGKNFVVLLERAHIWAFFLCFQENCAFLKQFFNKKIVIFVIFSILRAVNKISRRGGVLAGGLLGLLLLLDFPLVCVWGGGGSHGIIWGRPCMRIHSQGRINYFSPERRVVQPRH